MATAADRTIWYSIKQDGFEDSYLQADPAHRTGWEKWQELPLPGHRKDAQGNWRDEEDDQSAIDKEKKELSITREGDSKGDLLIRSRYKTCDQSALAPVQLVSGLGHLYIFRQSKAGTLLVDRFVLDGMTNELVRKLEVRFKRSGQKYQPLQSTQNGKPGKLATIDSLDFRDANNLPFYEPTTELNLEKNLHEGWFSVVLVPTNDHDVHRWHIFAYNSKAKDKPDGPEVEAVEIISIRSSEEGLFDVKDHFVVHPQPATVSGIVRRTLALNQKVTNGIAATKYDIQIERQDKARESFFNNFNSRLTDSASLAREANSGDAPTPVGVRRSVNEKPEGEATDPEKKAAMDKQIEQDKKAGEANVARTSKVAESKRAEIDAKISSREKRTHAQGSLEAWQKKMEDLHVRAGKRNIVNNYVWDADGGMRAETQSFANTAAHTVGGSASLNAAIGGGTDFFAGGLSVALTAQATMSLVQSMAKTQNHSTGFGLDVNVGGKLGVEFEGVTDHNDRPLMPGEKVDRYRFMSFYLEGSTKNFVDFFDYVVDPEWLASNDEEARALRQANGKANKTWRVLHRVTYVERPSLMGFGRDMRSLPKEEKPTVEEQVQSLSKAVEELKEMLKKQGD